MCFMLLTWLNCLLMLKRNSMYKPLNCLTMAELKSLPQIRTGIQGYGGTGKTWSALSFPNPVVANSDRGLGAHIGRTDVIEVPFYDSAFCATMMAAKGAPYFPHMLKDIIGKWLDTEATKLEPDQTLVWDGNTGMQNAYHKWYGKNKVYYDGVEDTRAEWGIKKKWYAEIIEQLKSLKCHVVFISHEAEKKEKDGEYRGKIRPLISGSFGDELMTHFTDWFRQLSADKYTAATATPAECSKWGMTQPELLKWQERFPRNTIYYWQTESDSVFDGKCSSLVNFPRFVPAEFSTFEKYRRKISTP